MKIEAKTWSGWEHFNITGRNLRTKFSILQKPDGYYATSAMGNSELIQFIDSLNAADEKREYNNYYWWKVDPNEIIAVMNAVIREFE